MAYRNNRQSPDRQVRDWIKSNRATLLSLGICHQTLDEPDNFFHDFILHAYGLDPKQTLEQKADLLRFLIEEWGDDVLRPASWDRVARSIGPNCLLCAETGELEHGQFWFQTEGGDSPATVIKPKGDTAECYVWNDELLWVGCQFRGVRGDYHVASGYVSDVRQVRTIPPPQPGTPTTVGLICKEQ